MRSVIPILVSLGLVLAVPFLFRQPETKTNQTEDELVIISPHNETIRFEFTRAFADYYRKASGRSVHIDWRLPGGTTEIVRYLNSE
ncbi:MAG: iron(III) transport system substrate-binding protein, partial [Verrucomicrobiota bacterium]|nr:iron(III) transport system substrate-binding protein [Verrucomicrobiota bacterium]